MRQLENDVVVVGLESSEVSQHLDSLTLTQEALDEEITKHNKLLMSNQSKFSSFVTFISQKQSTIASYNKKIYQIAASTGVRDSVETVIAKKKTKKSLSVVYVKCQLIRNIADIKIKCACDLCAFSA